MKFRNTLYSSVTYCRTYLLIFNIPHFVALNSERHGVTFLFCVGDFNTIKQTLRCPTLKLSLKQPGLALLF